MFTSCLQYTRNTPADTPLLYALYVLWQADAWQLCIAPAKERRCTLCFPSVLQDVVIVGCACAGLMGVGPDSLPVEVDPMCTSSKGRAAAAARKKAGLQPPATKGVAVLLGKLPPGCVARAFAQEVRPALWRTAVPLTYSMAGLQALRTCLPHLHS